MSEKLIPMQPHGHERTISTFSDVQAALERQAYTARDKAALAVYNGETPSVIVAAEREAADADKALLEAYELQKHLGHVSELPEIHVESEQHEKPITDVYVGDIFYNGEQNLVINFSSERIIDEESYYTVELETQLTNGSVVRDISILTRDEALALVQSKGAQIIEEGHDRQHRDTTPYANVDTSPKSYDPDDMSTWPAPAGSKVTLPDPTRDGSEQHSTQNEQPRVLIPQEQSQQPDANKPENKAASPFAPENEGVVIPESTASAQDDATAGENSTRAQESGAPQPQTSATEEQLQEWADTWTFSDALEQVVDENNPIEIEQWMSKSTKEKVLGRLATGKLLLVKAKRGAKAVSKSVGNWSLDRLPDESGSGAMSARHYAGDETDLSKKVKSKVSSKFQKKQKSGTDASNKVATENKAQNPEIDQDSQLDQPGDDAPAVELDDKSSVRPDSQPQEKGVDKDSASEASGKTDESKEDDKGLLPPERLRDGLLNFEALFAVESQSNPSLTREEWKKLMYNFLKTTNGQTVLYRDPASLKWVSGSLDMSNISADSAILETVWLTQEQAQAI